MFAMRDAHLRNVDLNLLRTIQPLLEERHISRAAKRSFLSQPAMSRALKRLREAFADPLLVRSNGAYERTPRGERVLREIETIMRRLNAVVNDQEFIPAQSRERFRMAMTDHGSTILLPKLLERLRKNAPDSELVLSAVGPQTYDEVAAGRIDLNLFAEEVPPTPENEIIFRLAFLFLRGASQRRGGCVIRFGSLLEAYPPSSGGGEPQRLLLRLLALTLVLWGEALGRVS